MDSPADYLPAFNKALADTVHNINPDYGRDNKAQFAVGFSGNFGANHVTPRNLSASLVNKLVCVDGIVTKCSLVRYADASCFLRPQSDESTT
jgi:DNA replication licensing factor MCM3